MAEELHFGRAAADRYVADPRHSRQVQDQPGLRDKHRRNSDRARLFGQAGSGQEALITGADTILRPIPLNILFASSGEKTFSPSSPKRLSFLFLLGRTKVRLKRHSFIVMASPDLPLDPAEASTRKRTVCGLNGPPSPSRKSSTRLASSRLLRSPALSRGPLCFASLPNEKICHNIFSVRKRPPKYYPGPRLVSLFVGPRAACYLWFGGLGFRRTRWTNPWSDRGKIWVFFLTVPWHASADICLVQCKHQSSNVRIFSPGRSTSGKADSIYCFQYIRIDKHPKPLRR